MTLTVGSLFSGIAGLDLGLERAGMEIRWQSEIDPYCCRVLAKHYPHVPNLGDITKIVDWEKVERVDLVCGGFPCQPVSVAGKQRGQDDERWLWPEFARCLRGIRPRIVLVENVPGLLVRGFGDVLGDLAELGYDAEWDCIPAAAVGAPHLRYRVFVVAHTDRESEPGVSVDAVTRPGVMVSDPDISGLEGPQSAERRDLPAGRGSALADPDGERRDRWAGIFGEGRGRQLADRRHEDSDAAGHARRLRDGDGEAIGDHWAIEPDVGRVAHGVSARVDRLRALGNAVVPQVAEFIGRRILEAV